MPRLLEIAMATLLGTQCVLNAGETAAPAWPPPERLLKWNPGVRGGIPTVPEAVALKDLPADGKADIRAALQKAIDEVKVPGAVVLPAGTFLLKSRINVKSGVVLRGAGLDKTHIIVDAPEGWARGKPLVVCSQMAAGISGGLIPLPNDRIIRTQVEMSIELTDPETSMSQGFEAPPAGADWAWCG